MENKEGEELIVAHLNQGDLIGEIGLFLETIDRTVTVKAKNDCRTEEITYEQIKTLSSSKLKECFPQTIITFSRKYGETPVINN